MSSSSYHIDHIENGVLFGWFYDAATPDVGATFLIEVNGRVAARGIADRYRQDLEETGMSNGKHAFQCAMPWTASGPSLAIRLLDSSGEPATGDAFAVDVPDAEAVVHYRACDGLNLHFDVLAERDLGEARFNLFCDGERLPQIYAQIDAGAGVLTIAVPDLLRSRIGRFVSLGFAEQVPPLWCGQLSIPDRQGAFLAVADALPQQLRSEALRDRLMGATDYADSQNLMLAHAILTERRSLKGVPPVVLPAATNPDVSIALVAHTDIEATFITLASLLLAPVNASFDLTLFTDQPEAFEPAFANLPTVGLSGAPIAALNSWANKARGAHLVFLDAGYEVTAGWLDALLEPLAKETIGAVLAGVQLGEGKIPLPSEGPDTATLDTQAPAFSYLRRLDTVTEGALAVRRSLFVAQAGFPSDEASVLGAKAALCKRLRNDARVILHQPFARLYQNKGGAESVSAIPLETAADPNCAKPRQVLVVDQTTPDASRDAGSYAALQEMKLMQALGFEITFLPVDLAYDVVLTTALQRKGIETQYAPWCQSVAGFLRERLGDFDAVYITRYGVAEAVIDDIKRLAPTLPILFNNADLHFLRELRGAISDGASAEALAGALATRERELAICRKADAVLCYNQLEHVVIASHLMQVQNFQLTPWVLEEKDPGGDWEAREGLFFLGNFHHAPNIQALMFILNEIMPQLAEHRPEICLYVYGANMPAQFQAFAEDNVKICGFAEDLDTVFHRHRVFVAPLLSGAGIKGKVLEAMAYGLPAIITDIAAEGTNITDQASALIANSPAEWIEAIHDLYDDAHLWRRIAENQRAIAADQYSFENGLERFAAIFESVGIPLSVEPTSGADSAGALVQ